MLTYPDHAPYAQAFNELSHLIFLELVEDAAFFSDAFRRTHDVAASPRDHEEGDGEGDAEEEDSDAEEASEDAPGQVDDEVRAFGGLAWEGGLDLALAAGFMLKVKADGWKLFCGRLNVPPLLPWEALPGFKRLRRALVLAETDSFAPEGFLRWLNQARPEGTPALTTIPWTDNAVANSIEEAFRERVRWWGG